MKILQISAGRERSIALAADGSAFGWGGIKLLGATLPPGYPADLCISNPTEIGHNRYAQPIPQHLTPDAPFSSVVDGYVDTLAVRQSGDVLSCRPVVSATLGAEQSALAGLPPSAVQVALTESGGYALYANGSVWSWGMRANGQLGREVVLAISDPAEIKGLPPVSALACGHGHVLALDRKGKVWAWGANAAGQLGTGSLTASALPTALDLPATIRHIAAGDTHSFAVDTTGRLWGWGSNNFGQVGETRDTRLAAKYFTVPHRIKTGFRVAQMDAGMFYTVATSTDGDVFTWGWNGMGQLGQTDAMGFSPRPAHVKQLTNVTQLAAGVGHTLALNDLDIFAWGDNRASACGAFPSIAVQATPIRVSIA